MPSPRFGGAPAGGHAGGEWSAVGCDLEPGVVRWVRVRGWTWPLHHVGGWMSLMQAVPWIGLNLVRISSQGNRHDHGCQIDQRT